MLLRLAARALTILVGTGTGFVLGAGLVGAADLLHGPLCASTECPSYAVEIVEDG